jgi:GMP synthase (glutamine-hydrolysing)
MSDRDRGLFGVQWHPEVAHTAEGEAVFEAFVEICRAHAETETEASAETGGI